MIAVCTRLGKLATKLHSPCLARTVRLLHKKIRYDVASESLVRPVNLDRIRNRASADRFRSSGRQG